jgi:hypothetical protein
MQYLKDPVSTNVKLKAFINVASVRIEEIEEAPFPLEEDRGDLGLVRLL